MTTTAYETTHPAALLSQILCFWALSIILFIFQNTNVSETGFSFRLKVKTTQLGTIVRASPIVMWVFVDAVTVLPCRCVAMIEGYTYIDTDWWEEFIKYPVEMGSCAMICIPDSIKTYWGVQKLIRGINRYIDGMVISWVCTYSFRIKKVDYKRLWCLVSFRVCFPSCTEVLTYLKNYRL
jgi:hypothetical protein